MKLLLVGPYPPPHGGVSVHVAGLKDRADRAGVPCRVLNTERSAPNSKKYVRNRTAAGFIASLARYSFSGWTIDVHTNGHNTKSWIVALLCALAGVAGRKPGQLMIHSGMTPEYLAGSAARRRLARVTCRLYGRITCVNPRIQTVIESLGVPAQRIQVAFAGAETIADSSVLVRDEPFLSIGAHAEWLRTHQPLLVATGGAGPEYGVDLLLNALDSLKSRFPDIGCVVMGVNETVPRDAVRMVGDIPHNECLCLISKANVFVRPTFADGDSISVREALALKIPVIASDCAQRPAGTVLFETGNSRDLVERLECVLMQCSTRFAQ